MPRGGCTVCRHPRRREIDAWLTECSVSHRTIAEQTGLSRAALSRHRTAHTGRTLLALADFGSLVEGDDLLAQARHLQERALTILREAESSGSLRLALAAISTARANLELLARLRGELSDATTVNVQNNVAVIETAEWLDVRERLWRALQPFPEARRAAAAALTDEGRHVASN